MTLSHNEESDPNAAPVLKQVNSVHPNLKLEESANQEQLTLKESDSSSPNEHSSIVAIEATQAEEVVKTSTGSAIARDRPAIASEDRFQVKINFRHWVIAFSISVLIVAMFAKCSLSMTDPLCFQAIVLIALATIAACTNNRGTRAAMLFCLSLQLFNSTIVLLPVSNFADIQKHCFIYILATVLWTAFIVSIFSINKKLNTHVRKSLPQQEQTVEIDCGTPGNGFIMNWIVCHCPSSIYTSFWLLLSIATGS